ncbi:MAG: hypothetical protein Q9170_006007 [Blastenia crenularia]
MRGDIVDRRRSFDRKRSWTIPKDVSYTTVRELHQPTQLSNKTPCGITKSSELLEQPPLINLPTPPASDTVSEHTFRLLEMTPEIEEHRKPSRCPIAQEFEQVQTHHPVLASTGCSKSFCQAGRAVHTDEPRIGENRSLEAVEKEAEGFLQELHRDGFFDNDEAFSQRLDDVLAEIKAGAGEGVIREGHQKGTVAGNWRQTSAELEFGIRRAWRNARKCIMRSHSDELK